MMYAQSKPIPLREVKCTDELEVGPVTTSLVPCNVDVWISLWTGNWVLHTYTQVIFRNTMSFLSQST